MRTVGVMSTMLLLLALAAPAAAQSLLLNPSGVSPGAVRALDQPARLQVERVPLATALEELHDRAGVNVLFSPTMIPASREVQCDCASVTVARALTSMLE